ncbi:hypothetical protein ColTof4_14451 [Colletotrichum tofieldiae]|nr:hypothetical protein ColTof4_14451 [Colletotrichum tofieldiae]
MAVSPVPLRHQHRLSINADTAATPAPSSSPQRAPPDPFQAKRSTGLSEPEVPVNDVKSILLSAGAQEVELSLLQQKKGLIAIGNMTVDPLSLNTRPDTLKGVAMQRSNLTATTEIAKARLDSDERKGGSPVPKRYA